MSIPLLPEFDTDGYQVEPTTANINQVITAVNAALTEAGLLTDLADSESEVATAVGDVATDAARIVLAVHIQSAASAVDQNVFVADRAYQVVSITESHAVAGTDGSAVTLDVKKCTGSQAPSAGTSMFFAGTINLKATANSVTSMSLTGTTATLQLAAENRIAFDITGTPTSYAGGVVTIVLRPI